MSTKIEHGYQLPALQTKELFAWTKRLKARFEAGVPARIRAEVTKQATQLLDTCHTDRLFKLRRPAIRTETWADSTPLSITFHNVQDELKESQRRCMRDDHLLEVTILEAEGKLLCLLHNRSRYVETWFRKHSGATPFPYWNNTDKPDPLSQKEWDNRGRLWDKALGNNTPLASGLGFQSHDPSSYLWQVKEQAPTPPTFRKRAKEQAKNYLWHLHGLANKGSEWTGSQIMETAYRIDKHKGVGAIAKTIEAHLPKIRRWSDLDTTIPSILKTITP